jgi:hypothetical protein
LQPQQSANGANGAITIVDGVLWSLLSINRKMTKTGLETDLIWKEWLFVMATVWSGYQEDNALTR